jgi:ketosteroid isomerase-like protein
VFSRAYGHVNDDRRSEGDEMSTAVNGRTAVERYLAAAEAGDTEAVREVLAEGDQLVVEWTSRARSRAGRPYENFCIGVFTVRDGRIHAVREYMDTLYAHRVAFAGSG